ncbi:hypothetical protein AKJ09_09431 [Labilithrix luteola]|uniref:Outer membrane protein beta-barrel domain-containing protein n=1 Tax=Labilithrix luteola TaxID=1391654 RepID=A0A0K1QAL3_9BACT|nr:hypothetical protein AKJ09_09431 [Labilithrix luteola]
MVLGGVAGALGLLVAAPASAGEASVTVGSPNRFAEPPARVMAPEEPPSAPRVVDDRFVPARELRRSSFRLELGPTAITTGKGFGLGVGASASFGSGSVGGRLSAAWTRGEGTSNGSVAVTGDAVGQYGGEITLDLLKRGPVHPLVGMGVALVHVSRPDTSGFAGVGTGRIGVEYALGFDDADVRIGADVTGGLIGPVDSDVKDLRAYALAGAHIAIGF